MAFSTELGSLKNLYANTKKSQRAKAILRMKSNVKRLPNFRLYYKSTVMKTVWYWHRNRNIDEMEQHRKFTSKITKLIYGNGGKNIQCRKDILYNK